MRNPGPAVAGILLLFLLLSLIPAVSGQESGAETGYVTFITTPPGAKIVVEDTTIGTTPLADQPFPPGTYLYTLLKDGYVPVQTSFDLKAGQRLTVSKTLQPLSPTPPSTIPTTIPTTRPTTPPPPGLGSIAATTSPAGASIFLNGQFQGYAPLVIPNLQPRTYTVLARLEGYSDYAASVMVSSNTQARFDAVLEPSPIHRDYGYISVSSSPSGARVSIDGTYRGITPATITEYPGSHTVLVQMSGYSDYSQQVYVTADTTQFVTATLSPVPPVSSGSLLVVSSPPVANVYLDGNYRGQTDSGGSLVISNLAPRSYQVEVSKSRYYDYTAAVTVYQGQQAYVQATLVPVSPTVIPTTSPVPGGTGSLSISSSPSGAQVYIDNVFRGYTPSVYDGLAQGMHSVTLKNPGYVDFQAQFQVAAGQTTNLAATLTPAGTPTQSGLTEPVLAAGLLAAGILALFRRNKP